MKKSIRAAIEEIALILRKETKAQKIKSRHLTILGPANAIESIAKLMRDEIHKQKKKTTDH